MDSDSDDEMLPMEPGENAPLKKGSSDPHGPKADKVSPEEFPETAEGIEAFKYAIYMETNEAAGIDLWKNRFVEPNTEAWKNSAGDPHASLRTTPDRFTINNYNECRAKCNGSLKKLHPDKWAWPFLGMTPGKSTVIMK